MKVVLLCVQLLQLIQPVENQWHASIIQNKSRNRIEKTRFAQKASCCFGEILANIAWRIGNLFECRASSIDHGDKVFEILVTPPTKTISRRKGASFVAASSRGRKFGSGIQRLAQQFNSEYTFPGSSTPNRIA